MLLLRRMFCACAEKESWEEKLNENKDIEKKMDKEKLMFDHMDMEKKENFLIM